MCCPPPAPRASAAAFPRPISSRSSPSRNSVPKRSHNSLPPSPLLRERKDSKPTPAPSRCAVSSLEPRAAVRLMAPYSPPSAGREGKLRLDFNENTVGCSPKVIEFLRSKLSAPRLSIYPEYVEAVPELAAFFGVSPGEFTLTNETD